DSAEKQCDAEARARGDDYRGGAAAGGGAGRLRCAGAERVESVSGFWTLTFSKQPDLGREAGERGDRGAGKEFRAGVVAWERTARGVGRGRAAAGEGRRGAAGRVEGGRPVRTGAEAGSGGGAVWVSERPGRAAGGRGEQGDRVERVSERDAAGF